MSAGATAPAQVRAPTPAPSAARARLSRLLNALRHPVSQNALALYGVQMATFIVPLVTLPYTSRVLGPEAFGLVVFSQGLSFMLSLVIDWGFPGSATRQAAALRDDREGLSHLAARVLGAKALLSLITLPVAVVALMAVPDLHENPSFLFLALVAAIVNSLTPLWFFIGIERMRLISLIQLGSRVLSAVVIFTCVTQPAHAWLVLGAFAAVSLGSCVVVNWLMYRRIALMRPQLRPAVAAIKEAWTLFVGTAALTMYTTLNVVLLGFFVSSAHVAHFGAAERIVRSGLQLLTPVVTAAYPRMALLNETDQNGRAKRLAMIAAGVLVLAGLGAAGGLALLAPFIVSLVFGPGYEEAVGILRIIALLIPACILSQLASGWMMSLKLDRQIVGIVLRAGVLNIALAIVLVPDMGATGMALAIVVSEFFAAGGYLWAILRHEGHSPATAARVAAARLPGLRDRFASNPPPQVARTTRSALRLTLPRASWPPGLPALAVSKAREGPPPRGPSPPGFPWPDRRAGPALAMPGAG